MSTKKLQILGSLGNKVYTQPDEPTNAPEGAVWVDLDDDGATDNIDAATLDGKDSSYFASASDVSTLQTLVGDTSVSLQIANALSNKTLASHLQEENMVLTSLQYGDTLPPAGIPGRIFFKKVGN